MNHIDKIFQLENLLIKAGAINFRLQAENEDLRMTLKALAKCKFEEMEAAERNADMTEVDYQMETLCRDNGMVW